jgi:hypothetical protein
MGSILRFRLSKPSACSLSATPLSAGSGRRVVPIRYCYWLSAFAQAPLRPAPTMKQRPRLSSEAAARLRPSGIVPEDNALIPARYGSDRGGPVNTLQPNGESGRKCPSNLKKSARKKISASARERTGGYFFHHSGGNDVIAIAMSDDAASSLARSVVPAPSLSSARRAAANQVSAIWMKPSRSRLDLAVRAQPKHSSANDRYSAYVDTTHIPARHYYGEHIGLRTHLRQEIANRNRFEVQRSLGLIVRHCSCML